MIEKTDLEKIGVKTIRPFKKNNRWVFDYGGQIYDMAPAEFTSMVLSPIVVGVDRIMSIGCKLKDIKTPENGFNLLFSESYFPNADVRFDFVEQKFDGLIYSVEALNIPGIPQDQSVWVCSYINLYFSSFPRTLYLKMEP